MAEDTVTLDLRNLSHKERLPSVLGGWNSLKAGQTLRIVNDHDPSPLKYLFRSEFTNQFDWQYESEGPTEWVVRITKKAPTGTEAGATSIGEADQQTATAFKGLLKRLNAGAPSAAVKEEARNLLLNLDARKLAFLEQELIQEGIGREGMRSLCDVHLDLMREGLEEGRLEAEPGHPVHTLMEEHKIIKQFLERLREFNERLQTATALQQLAEEWEMPRDAVHHLVEAEKHYQREEQVLFPELEKRGVTEPPQIMLLEHEELRAKTRSLDQLSQHPEKYSFPQLVKEFGVASDYLVRELSNHIYKEDNILYQIALQTIDRDEWADLKKRCDEIGYCCFTLTRLPAIRPGRPQSDPPPGYARRPRAYSGNRGRR